MKLILFICSYYLASFHAPGYVHPDKLVGTWQTEKNEGTVEIFKSHGFYYGVLIALKEPYDKKHLPKTDSRNKKVEQRNRPLIGILVISNMKYNELKERWDGGKIYIPKVGYEAECIIYLVDHDTLKVKGFKGSELVGQTNIWTRLSD